MVREFINETYIGDRSYREFFGLSTDDKPTGLKIITGSKFTEVDTGIAYLFDEVSGEWFAQGSGNGKTSIAGATVVLGSSPTYDGSQKTQTVSSVKIGATTLVADTDYKIKNNTGTNVGSYELQIVGIGSYTGAISETWEIEKGTGSVTASPDELTLTEGGDNGTSTLTVVGDGEVSVESSAAAVATASVSDTTVTVVPVAAGSATITVTLADGESYEGGTDTISVTVEAGE